MYLIVTSNEWGGIDVMFTEGVFENYEDAVVCANELNKDTLGYINGPFYEEEWGEDSCPEWFMEYLENTCDNEAEMYEKWDEELEKHRIKDLDEICKIILTMDYPPAHFFSIEEIKKR